jgi:glyoxylase-like metal-dependent hydrolase (beta-lactamase superfamily II)
MSAGRASMRLPFRRKVSTMSPLFRVSILLFLSIAPAAASAEPSAAVTLNRFTTTDRSWGANAYWLESEQGIVVIDALFLRPDAENLAAVLESRKKPVLGVILTHPHVDHFGGLGTLRRHFPKLPIFATRAAADNVKIVHDRAFEQKWIQAYGEDYDPVAITPDHVVESGTSIELGGMHFSITSFGEMESADNALVYNKELDALFTGDAVLHGAIYYLGEGHSAGAVAGLEKIAGNWPATQPAYPSHGDSGRLGSMVEFDLAQVRYMRNQVELALDRPKALLPEGRLSDPARARLFGLFTEHFRNYLNFGLGVETVSLMNLAGIEKELLDERAKKKGL